jgi:hypothetical protein
MLNNVSIYCFGASSHLERERTVTQNAVEPHHPTCNFLCEGLGIPHTILCTSSLCSDFLLIFVPTIFWGVMKDETNISTIPN